MRFLNKMKSFKNKFKYSLVSAPDGDLTFTIYDGNKSIETTFTISGVEHLIKHLQKHIKKLS